MWRYQIFQAQALPKPAFSRCFVLGWPFTTSDGPPAGRHWLPSATESPGWSAAAAPRGVIYCLGDNPETYLVGNNG